MVIVESDGRGADVAGTTGGVLGMMEGVEDVASGMGTIEGAAGAGGMISIGISTYCACGGCSSSSIFRGAGIAGASGYAI